LILESGGQRREFKVDGPMTVGRSPSASVHLEDKTLSREHTQFYLERGRLCVRDLGSKNGTLLNGQLLKSPVALKPGDKVRVGDAVFIPVFEQGDPMPAVAAPLAAPPPRAAVHATGPATATAAPVARARAPLGPHPASVLVYRVVLLAVVVGGAYLSKGLFHQFLIPRLP
jgi:predicted component of type VI protein secretion system